MTVQKPPHCISPPCSFGSEAVGSFYGCPKGPCSWNMPETSSVRHRIYSTSPLSVWKKLTVTSWVLKDYCPSNTVTTNKKQYSRQQDHKRHLAHFHLSVAILTWKTSTVSVSWYLTSSRCCQLQKEKLFFHPGATSQQWLVYIIQQHMDKIVTVVLHSGLHNNCSTVSLCVCFFCTQIIFNKICPQNKWCSCSKKLPNIKDYRFSSDWCSFQGQVEKT